MTFEELIAMLREPPEEGVPATIYDDLSGAYNGLSESSAAKVAEQDGVIQGLNAEISRLKAANYDLMVQASAVPDDAPDDAPDDSETGIDDLFEKGSN